MVFKWLLVLTVIIVISIGFTGIIAAHDFGKNCKRPAMTERERDRGREKERERTILNINKKEIAQFN